MLRTLFIGLILASVAAFPTQAEVFTWEQTATEDQVKNAGTEDGSTDSGATGASTITYDSDTKILDYDVAWDSLENQLTKIHVHGPAGPDASNAAHLFNIFPEETDVIASGVDRFTDSTEDSGKLKDFVLDTRSPFNTGVVLSFMLQDAGYVNIHSSGFPMGEIRGNLVLTGGEPESGTKSHRRCTARANEVFQDVADAEVVSVNRCIKRGTKGTLPGTIAACLDAEPSDDVEDAMERAAKRFEKKCHGFDDKGRPRYPFYARPAGNDPSAPTTSSIADYVNRLAREKEMALAYDLFTTDPDAVIALNEEAPATAKCQRGVLKQVQSCQAKLVTEFRRCVDTGLEGGAAEELYEGADDPFDDIGDVEACFDFDGRGKIDKQCSTEMEMVILEKCDETVELDAAFPGCDVETPEGLASCAGALVLCEACQSLNAVDEMAIDCDLADDDSDNDSCPVEFED